MNYFFDIGANSGQAFDWHLNKTTEYDGWEVLLFEPSPRSFSALLEKATQMSARYNVTVVPFAIGTGAKTAKFYQSEDSLCDTLQSHSVTNDLYNRPDKKAGYQIVVAVMSLPEFILQHTNMEDSIVIKMDCEGAEYGIIKDLLNQPRAIARVKEMLIEWHWIDKDQVSERKLEQTLTESLRSTGVDVKSWW